MLFISIYICVMSITIQLNKADVMPEVYKITGYTGAKTGDVDKISSTEDDENILDSYFGEAASYLDDILGRWGYLSQDNSTGCQITLDMPSNWNANVLSSLTKTMKQYMVDYICMQWFNLSKKDDVEYYSSLCAEISQSIKRYLLERIRPTRN